MLASAPGKPSIEIATPREFNGIDPDRWSPEDFLVAAVASCYAVTLIAIATAARPPPRALDQRRRRRRAPRHRTVGFTDIDLHLIAATDPGNEDASARRPSKPKRDAWFPRPSASHPLQVRRRHRDQSRVVNGRRHTMNDIALAMRP
jgi:OsmC-like protein